MKDGNDSTKVLSYSEGFLNEDIGVSRIVIKAYMQMKHMPNSCHSVFFS